MKPSRRVLVVDDSEEMARVLADRLEDAGWETSVAASGEEALRLARQSLPDVVITDLRMGDVDGMDVLAGVRALDPCVPVLIMTAFGAIDTAVEAIKRGAYNYLTKPFSLDEAVVFVERAHAERRLLDENRALRRVAVERSGLGAMVGSSDTMRRLYELIERVAQSPAPVLIRGESGTGKELVARALHYDGPRREGPFVAANCTNLPEALLESELYGHAKGSFTGATSARRGLFVEADGGTLFLDEIGDMPSALQARLLRTLENGEIRPVGADSVRHVDVRVIAATHRNLEEAVREGSFRADLFFRLDVVPITVAPLRDRIEDVPALVACFIARARERNPMSRVERFSSEVLAAFARHSWPGNVRELQNLVERLVVVCTSADVGPEDLEAHGSFAPAGSPSPIETAQQALVPLRQVEADYIAWVIAQCGGNKTRAAEILGIDVSTIHRRERGGDPRGR